MSKGKIKLSPLSTILTLVVSIQATIFLFSSLCIVIVVDLNTLHQDILLALSSEPITTKHISTDGQ